MSANPDYAAGENSSALDAATGVSVSPKGEGVAGSGGGDRCSLFPRLGLAPKPNLAEEERRD